MKKDVMDGAYRTHLRVRNSEMKKPVWRSKHRCGDNINIKLKRNVN